MNCSPAVVGGPWADPLGAGRRTAERRRDLRTYRRVCREIDKLLTEGRLLEAQRLNEQARVLFKRLYGI